MILAMTLRNLLVISCILIPTTAFAQNHPFVGKWREKVSHTGDIDLTITGVRPDGFIVGNFEVPRFPSWNCTFSDRVDAAEKLATGKVNGEALFITLANGVTYDLKWDNGMLVGTAHGGRTWPMRFKRR